MAVLERVETSSDSPKVIKSSQNSRLREITKKPRFYVAGLIHKHTSLTADDLSKIGFVTGVVGAGVATYLNTHDTRMPSWLKRVIAGVAIAAPALIDCLDGPKSALEKEDRIAKAVDPERARYSQEEIQRTVHGGRLDFNIDRWQELTFTAGRYFTAKQRGSLAGQMAAGLAGRTNHKPSQARAEAEENVFVKEIVLGPEFFGNRVGRGVAASVATAFPELQPGIDLIVAGSNQLSYRRRQEEAKRPRSRTPVTTDKELFDKRVAKRLAPLKVEDAKKVGLAANIAFGIADILTLIRLRH